ncbi:hypothetical protein GCM10022377_16330 [Zhihengliuella alba]|uniref:Type II secretion system protein GspF domain-containing protein n=1 Tax=Zhihengliuella alba TaxID=547018 RepID=A0ABP7DEL4_9MICC
MSREGLIIAAAVAAALAVLLLFPRRAAPPIPARTVCGGRESVGRVQGRLGARLLDAWLDRAGDREVEAHTRALRQAASLLDSGRIPAEAWEMLAMTWSSGPAADAPERRRRDDIVAAATAARTAHTLGHPSSHGIRRHAERSPYAPVWERVHWCLRLSEETGAPLAVLLERLAEQTEAAYDLHRSRQSALAGPRATARMLAGLPAIGFLLAVLLGARPVELFLGNPLAQLSFSAGVAFWFVNQAWTRRLMRGARGRTGAGARPAAGDDVRGADGSRRPAGDRP